MSPISSTSESASKKMHREILHMALPSVLSNITVPLLSLVDLTIVGHLGSAKYIAAIAVGSTIFNMVYWIFSFLRMGTTGLTSQSVGSGNRKEMSASLLRSLSIALLLGLLQICLQGILFQCAIWLMHPAPEVTLYAQQYFRICIWGAPAMLLLYSFTGWFIGMQEARYPLYIALLQNTVNIACSLFFVYVLHWKVAGVATGTLIAQYAGVIMAAAMGYRLFIKKGLTRTRPVKELWHTEAIHKLFSVNRDIFLRTLCLAGVTLYFTSAGSRQGENILSANVILMQFFTFYSYFMDGFAYAGEALTGKYYGSRNIAAMKRMIHHLFIWGITLCILFTCIYSLAGKDILSLLTDEQSVLETSFHYIGWAIAIPACGMMAFIWDGVFVGLTATRQMLLSMFLSMLLFFIINGIFTAQLGNHALWLAFILYLFSRGGIQLLLFQKLFKNSRNKG